MEIEPLNKVDIHFLNKKAIPPKLAADLLAVADAGFEGKSPWSMLQFEQSLEAQSSRVFYATINQKIVGFIVVSESIDIIDVYMIVVDEAYKKQSVGTKLFESLVDYCNDRGIDAIVLETRKSNEPAINLYQRVGFEHIGVRKAYYSSPIEDAIVMRKEVGKEN